MHIYMIYNFQAGNMKAKKLFDKVSKLLAKEQITYTLFIPRYHKHAIEEVSFLELSTFDAIVAAGGDGTFFEVINGYMHNKSPKKPPIGFIPLGTGNAFSRSFSRGKML